MSADGVIRAALQPFVTTAGGKRELATDAVAVALEKSGLLLDYAPETVEVCGSRVAVETTTLGGLTITLDAAGNAVRVTSPYGLEIIE